MEMPTFDELRDLAQRDSQGFESLRAELIEDCIHRSSKHSQRRLRGLQFEIEARRRAAGNPMKALLVIQGMMHDSFISLRQALLTQPPRSEPPAPTGGKVLNFQRAPASVKSCKTRH